MEDSRSQYVKTGGVMCQHNQTKATYGHCKKFSDPDCGVGCGASSTEDAKKRCHEFLAME
jgi:hypothetical protein